MSSATGFAADIIAAAAAQIPKCPQPFEFSSSTTCVMPCPADKMFVREGNACVYSPDKQYKITLNTLAPAVFRGESLEDLRTGNQTRYTEFTREKDRFEQDFAKVYANMDEQKRIDDAFRDLQAAENARTESPEAYQVARTAYYTLVNGQEWINRERERIAAAEVGPEVQKYRNTLAGIQQQTTQQQRTMDVVQGVNDKVLSLRDDFKYSVDTLNDQVEKLKIQINMENRSREKETEPFWKWLDTVLNIVLLGALVYTAWIVYRKYSSRLIPAPTYTVQT